tara:strand:+ start:29 stop:754 length:726 start_codon:yes stop_codon:yes gene_type:complete
MKTIALIPARSGSKGIKNKNIINIGGKILLDWSIKACKKCTLIDEIIISTDSEEYAEHALNLGALVPFLRPKEISGDTSTDYEFVKHFLNWHAEFKQLPDLIAHIRPTTPFRDPKLMDEAINYYLSSNKKPTSLRSVHVMSESAYKTFEIGNSGNLICVGSNDSELDKANNARQSFPKTYIANGYIDILSVNFINKNKKIHGNRVLPFITPTTYELDTLEDIEFLEFQLNKNQKFFSRIFD